MGMDMHFEMSFNAVFDMNVNQGQAKQKESPAKKSTKQPQVPANMEWQVR